MQSICNVFFPDVVSDSYAVVCFYGRYVGFHFELMPVEHDTCVFRVTPSTE